MIKMSPLLSFGLSENREAQRPERYYPSMSGDVSRKTPFFSKFLGAKKYILDQRLLERQGSEKVTCQISFLLSICFRVRQCIRFAGASHTKYRRIERLQLRNR
jgi:hypothetical protein